MMLIKPNGYLNKREKSFCGFNYAKIRDNILNISHTPNVKDDKKSLKEDINIFLRDIRGFRKNKEL